MPSMDDLNLVAECRRHWPELPVIILTTFDDATIIRRFLAAGAGLLSSLGGGTGDISRAQNIILSQKTADLYHYGVPVRLPIKPLFFMLHQGLQSHQSGAFL